MFQISPLLYRSLIIENQNTCQSQSFDIPVHQMAREIKICDFINSFKQKNNIVVPITWKVYDPQILDYKPFQIQKPLSEIYFLSPVIMFKYREQNLPNDCCDILNTFKIEDVQKKGRKRERTIKQVVEYVKQWRLLQNSFDRKMNKINLMNAAKIVGIAKKSLDDYFCQLRLAQDYGFDFQANINQKIGVIRSFVRRFRAKQSKNNKHQKLPKKLKIIEDYQHFNLNILLVAPSTKVEKIKQEQNFLQTLIEYEPQCPLSSIIPAIQNQMQPQFLNGFNFMSQEAIDPFISHGYLQNNPDKMNQQQFYEYYNF